MPIDWHTRVVIYGSPHETSLALFGHPKLAAGYQDSIGLARTMDSEKRSHHVDKLGDPFEAGRCDDDCLTQVLDMYGAFTPKAVAQGLPPADEKARRAWLQHLFRSAENFAAWKSGKPVGHCALITDMDRLDAEYLIFVLGPHQNRGIGTVLTAMAVHRAIQLSLKNLWLTVEVYNFRAVRMYKNAGFQFCDECDNERTMLKMLRGGS